MPQDFLLCLGFLSQWKMSALFTITKIGRNVINYINHIFKVYTQFNIYIYYMAVNITPFYPTDIKIIYILINGITLSFIGSHNHIPHLSKKKLKSCKISFQKCSPYFCFLLRELKGCKKVQNNYQKYFLSKNWSCNKKVVTMAVFV